MGVWGTGLYSGDFALDLRKTVGAVARLPFEPDRLVDVLCETEPAAANNAGDEEHATFWLILADQFARRGIVSERVREKAVSILDERVDEEMLRRLGMTPADLRRRQRVLDDLRERLNDPPAVAKRPVLRKPQPLLMNVGDVIVYPTCLGRCINPYYPSKELDVRYTKAGRLPWQHDGWAAAVIVDAGRAFDYLSWYRPLTITRARPDKPSIATLREEVGWRLELAGTCSATHFKRMELEIVGAVAVERDRLRELFGELRPGISAAVNDISIANRLHVAADGSTSVSVAPVRDRRNAAINSINDISSR